MSEALYRWAKSHSKVLALLFVLETGFCVSCILADEAVEGEGSLREVEVILLDGHATGYGTFQSHNQKVVSNSYGIFTSHIRTRNEDYTAQTWRLSRSIDGGDTFRTVLEDTHATNPPVLETDREGNVYLMRPDFQEGDAVLYRLLAKEEFQKPHITHLPRGAAGKFAMVIDEPRGQLYYFAHNNTFHVVGLDGEIRSMVNLLQRGEDACLQYPLLDLASDGTLHAAWTTQKHNVYLYWDIHHMVSLDGGETWANLDGTDISIPAAADAGGPALRVSLDDEFDCHSWLSSFLFKGGKVHFLYLAQTGEPRQHYIRLDSGTGRRDVDIWPEFRGKTLSLRGLDSFFASSDQSVHSTLYAVGKGTDEHMICLRSEDNGGTWEDFARSRKAYVPYAVGGCRRLTKEGYILGTFTDQAKPGDVEAEAKVFFLRVKAEEAPRLEG